MPPVLSLPRARYFFLVAVQFLLEDSLAFAGRAVALRFALMPARGAILHFNGLPMGSLEGSHHHIQVGYTEKSWFPDIYSYV